MKNTEAEEWANEELKKYPKLSEIMGNAVEMMMFGSIGFKYKDGKFTKVSQQELWNIDNEIITFNSLEEYSEYLKNKNEKI